MKSLVDSLFGRSAGALAGTAAPPVNGLVTVDGKTFPLKSSEIRGRAEGGVAQSLLVQTYANPYEEPLEVIYTMPLPADGAVVGYTIELGERTITGHIEKAAEAREAYRNALESGRTAGLLEQSRADTFFQSLGNLPAGQSVRVELRVLHPLAFRPAGDDSSGCWEYRFPTVVGVRYEGAPGRVPDADKLDSERADANGTPVRLGLELVLGDGDPAALQPHSPSHSIRPETVDDGTRVSLSDAAALDRDLVVRWQATADEVGLRLVEGPGLPGDDGRYALLTITPPTRAEATFARDLTVLMDASGSMTGEPLESSKKVVRALLDSLNPEDRFEILSFASSVDHVVRGPVPATSENIRRAMRLVGRIHAGGATEMTQAMVEALQPLRPESQRQVTLLTDGFIGFESEVIGEVVRGLRTGCRLHVVGIGSAPNRSLTRSAARAGRGVELFVGDDEDVGAAVEQLLQATVGPVLTDLSIGGSATRSVAPARPRDVLAGQPLLVAVELDTKGGSVEVSGRLAGVQASWSRRLDVAHSADTRLEAEPSLAVTSIPVGAMFGREAVEDEEVRHSASVGPDAQARIDRTIEALGLRHRITTRLTSLVAISEEPTVDPSEPRRRKRLEAELPAGVSAEGVGLARDVSGLRSTLGFRETKTFECEDGILDQMLEAPAPESAPPSRARPFLGRDLFGAFRPVARRITIRARVLRIDDDLLVIEFESPADGFELPGDDEPIEIKDGRDWKPVANMDAALSTRRGPNDEGLTLRLALRRSDGKPWKEVGDALQWVNDAGEQVLVLTTRK
jgi:Ca-activated chloride channel family protein